MRSTWLRWLCPLTLLATSPGCATAPVHVNTTTPRFSLTVFEQRVGVVYAYADLVARLDARRSSAVIELTENDIVEYRTATEMSAPALVDGRIELVLTDAAACRLHAATPYSDTQAFEVMLDGERVYVGVLYVPIGAAAIATPILHSRDMIEVMPSDDVLVLSNGLVGGSPVDVDAPVLRAFFASLGRARQ